MRKGEKEERKEEEKKREEGSGEFEKRLTKIIGCNFTRFSSIDSLNAELLGNASYNASNIVGG